ncbi:MAG: hypothetical protein H0V64_12560 [Geodermatophilaceae bacterium]|nr:hypothetical protein [Geodermatophilaceae bacterium]
MSALVSRRQALGLGAALATGAASAGLGRSLRVTAAAAPTPAAGLVPVRMAMHIHACFSEDTASMDTHLDQAERTGVDVIWWTEHDFRVQAHGYRKAVRFEGMTEVEDDLDWTWVPTKSGPLGGAAGTFVDYPHSPAEPGKALRLAAQGVGEEWGRLQYEGTAWNSTYSTSIAATTLVLDVLAESLGPDAELLVEVLSSYRPASNGRPAGQYTLQYRIGAGAGRFTEESGLLGVVATRAGVGWRRLTLRLAEDVAAVWPDVVAGDAALYRLRLSVRARRGATARVVVDRLRFLRGRREDQQALGLQAGLMAAYADRYPSVRQYQGAELSLVRHVNRFGGKAFLPDYGDGPPLKDESLGAAMAMVDLVHANGGVASHNHPLGGVYRQPRDLGRMLVQTRNLGAEILEVGCGANVDEVTDAYDIAARNGVFITATGVSDDHTGEDWLARVPRWITTAWAASTEAPELVDALSGGRIWFSDPAGWRGGMEISAQGVRAMGGVLVTTDARVPMKVSVSDLPADSTLELVTGEVDFAGPDQPDPAVTTVRVPARDVHQGGVWLDFEPGAGRYLRAAIRDSEEKVVGFSNPTWVLPRIPPGGVPPQRRL